jgi:hypothetical protein
MEKNSDKFTWNEARMCQSDSISFIIESRTGAVFNTNFPLYTIFSF